MATFADLMSLLLCFFVLLLSFAQQDVSKFKTLMGSIKEAFGVQIKRKDANFAAFSPSQFEREDLELNKETKEILEVVLGVKSTLSQDPDLQKVTNVSTENSGVIIRIPVSELFLPESANLLPDAAGKLAAVVTVMQEHNMELIVRSHTSDLYSSSTPLYPTNWELSSARAAATIRTLIEIAGLPSSRMKAVGYADSQPLLPNSTDKNRAVNNRIEFYFLKNISKSW